MGFMVFAVIRLTKRVSIALEQVDIEGLTITLALAKRSSRKSRHDVVNSDFEILKDAHLKLRPGVSYGLLGRNGTGKSSEILSYFPLHYLP